MLNQATKLTFKAKETHKEQIEYPSRKIMLFLKEDLKGILLIQVTSLEVRYPNKNSFGLKEN